jgi:hypothetical protein
VLIAALGACGNAQPEYAVDCRGPVLTHSIIVAFEELDAGSFDPSCLSSGALLEKSADEGEVRTQFASAPRDLLTFLNCPTTTKLPHVDFETSEVLVVDLGSSVSNVGISTVTIKGMFDLSGQLIIESAFEDRCAFEITNLQRRVFLLHRTGDTSAGTRSCATIQTCLE